MNPGMPFTIGLGSFTDTDPNSNPDDFIPTIQMAGGLTQGVEINWGDGSPRDFGGTIRANASPGQGYAVTGTHTYDAVGNYLVTVTIADINGSTSSNTLAISVVAAAAGKVAVAGGKAIPLGFGSYITAGKSLDSTVAVFTATLSTAVASNFNATIDWGDEDVAKVNPDTSVGTIVQGANDPTTGAATFFVSGSHIYDKPGDYTFTVSVSTPGAVSTTFSATAEVSAAPLLSTPAPISGVQGEPLPEGTIVATFTDTAPVPNTAAYIAGTDAVINWGDGTGQDVGTVESQGSSPTGTVFVVYGQHTYQNVTDVFQAYQVSVTISTPDGGAAVVTDFADLTVPVLTDPPIAVHAQAGVAFNVPVATIHTTVVGATPANFKGTLQWGDGQTSAATLQSDGGGTFTVIGSHTYAKAGTFPVVISLTDNQGNTVSDHSTSTVTNPPVVAQSLSFSPTPLKTFTGNVGLFSDADTALSANSFAASITWGDGKTSTGTVVSDGVSASGPTYLITGSHKYAKKGTYAVGITILENGATEATTSIAITVGKPVPVPTKHPAVTKPKLVVKSVKTAMIKAKAVSTHPAGPLVLVKR